MRLFYNTKNNSLGIFFASPFPVNLEQTPIDLFSIFERLIRNLQNRWDSVTFPWMCDLVLLVSWKLALSSKRIWAQPKSALISDSANHFSNFFLFMENFLWKKRSKRMMYHSLSRVFRFSDCFIATPEFQIFSPKSIMMVKVVTYLAKSQLMVKFFRFLPKTEVAVRRCSIKKLFRRVHRKT